MTSEQPPLPAKAQTQPALKLPKEWTSFPSRQTIADKIRNSTASVLQKTAGHLREVLGHVKSLTTSKHVLERVFAATGDLWKAPGGADMFALQLTTIKTIIINNINMWDFKTFIIMFEHVAIAKTGSNLAGVVTDHTTAQGMTDLFEHVSVAVLDGAANNKTMAAKLKLEFEHCSAHRLNLVSKNAVAFLTRVSSKAHSDAELGTADEDFTEMGGGGSGSGSGSDDDTEHPEAAAAFGDIADEFHAVLHPVETISLDAAEPDCILDDHERRELRNMLEVLFGWAAIYHTSSTFKRALRDVRQSLNVPEAVKNKSLVQRCATRWSASYNCLERLCELWDSVNAVAIDASRGGRNYNYKNLKAKKLPNGYRQKLSELLAIMRVVDETMVALQSGFMPAGQAWLSLRGVYDLLDDDAEVDVRTWDSTGVESGEWLHIKSLSREAVALARLYRHYLRHYFRIDRDPEQAVLVSMALDPYCRAVIGLGLRRNESDLWRTSFVGTLSSDMQSARKVVRPARFGTDSWAPARPTGKLRDNGQVDSDLFKTKILPLLAEPLLPTLGSLRLPAAIALWAETRRCAPPAVVQATTAATAAQVAPEPELPPEQPSVGLTAQQRMFQSAAAYVESPSTPNAASVVHVLEHGAEFTECWSFLLLPVDKNVRGGVRPKLGDDHHALTWWAKHEKDFPLLALAARISFAQPSTSCMPESLFSRCKHLERDSQKGQQLPEMLAARTLLREAHAVGSSLSALELALAGRAKRSEKRRIDRIATSDDDDDDDEEEEDDNGEQGDESDGEVVRDIVDVR
jgi:hypothetical protein